MCEDVLYVHAIVTRHTLLATGHYIYMLLTFYSVEYAHMVPAVGVM